jgi:putative ABC transport system permease protein
VSGNDKDFTLPEGVERRQLIVELHQDVRLALRVFARAPVFTAALVLTLGIGAGVNGAVFSILRATLLHPLPYQDPDRLVMVWREAVVPPAPNATYGAAWWRRGVLTPSDVVGWRDRLARDVGDVAATVSWTTDTESDYDLVLRDGAERLRGARVTPNFFQVLGARARHGRVFTMSDAGGAPVVVLSHALWQRLFAGDSSVIGRTLTLTGERPREARVYTIAGVMPAGFRFTYPDHTELWTLMDWGVVERFFPRAVVYTTVVRLRDDVTFAQAQERAASLYDEIWPPPPGTPRSSLSTYRLEPIREWVLEQVRPSLLLLGGVAALLLLVTCATVANALLARISTRRQELAVRTALGASRARLLRQLLSEGFVLAIAGTLVGTLAVVALQPLLRRLLPASVPLVGEVETSAWLLVFALGLAALVTLLAALGPALTASYVQGIDRLLRGARGAGGRSASRLRRGLLAAQAAVSTTLLVCAALLLTSFWRLHRVPTGFDGSGVIALEIFLLDARARGEVGLRRFREELLARIRGIPGVQQAGFTSAIPFDEGGGVGIIRLPGDTTEFSAKVRSVDSAYFGVLRIPLLRGRLLSQADASGSSAVAVLTAGFARQLFGDRDPLGRSIVHGDTIRVVGIVGDMRYTALNRDVGPAMYVPSDQRMTSSFYVLVRAAGDNATVAQAMHRAVRHVDPTVPTVRVTTVDELRDYAMADRRFYTVATAAFAIVGLILTIVGLAMVVGRGVAERRRELAIRAALGATNTMLMRLISRESLTAVGTGVGLGIAGAYVLSSVLSQFMFGVTSRSLFAYVAVGMALVGISTVAALWAARPVQRLPLSALVSAE